MLAAVMTAALFAFTAFADDRDMEAAVFTTAEQPHVSGLQLSSQTPTFTGFAAYEHANMVLIANKTWVRESVGLPPLNVFTRAYAPVKPLDGYSDVLLKPKIHLIDGNITTTLAFTGLGHDHYARADV